MYTLVSAKGSANCSRGTISRSQSVPQSGPRLSCLPPAPAVARADALASLKDVFNPAGRNGVEMPEEMKAYMSLLAESTNSSTSMTKHLTHLLVKGAANGAKAFGFISNPVAGLANIVADSGSEMLLKQLGRAGAETKTRVCSGWNRLRSAVLVTGAFKRNHEECRHAKDDSCVPDQAVNPVQAKVLSALLSMMLTSVTPGVVQAMPDMPNVMLGMPQAAIEATHTVNADSHAFKFSAESAPSITSRHAGSFIGSSRQAGSFIGSSRQAGGSFIGAGGMAASTALRLLRADSKICDKMPDIADIFGTVMESFDETLEFQVQQELQQKEQQQQQPGQDQGVMVC